MRVLATAGHVDHGKSALVRALTGMETDRWQAEKDRGLTIDLGYAWTALPGGETVAFVDVPGHQRFIGNMLAGVGPAPAVVFVVAADAGWARQSTEHLAAVQALGVEHLLLVVTRADLADPAPALAAAQERLSAADLPAVAAVACSSLTGEGLEDVRAALDHLVAALPEPAGSRTRLWVDRAFTVRGAGTVVTGTLGAGQVAVGDLLALGDRQVRVRGIESLDQPRDRVAAVARVALNLADIGVDEVHRGDALVARDAYHRTRVVDVRPVPVVGQDPTGLPLHLMLHLGTDAQQTRVRPLGDGGVRLMFDRALPLAVGDRGILRNPGTQHILAGCVVLDTDPPALLRRGDSRRRGAALAGAADRFDLRAEVTRRGVLPVEEAVRLGADPEDLAAVQDLRRHRWLVCPQVWARWGTQLATAVEERAARDPLDPTLTAEAARAAVGIPDPALACDAAVDAGLVVRGGRVGLPGLGIDFGALESALQRIEGRLVADPCAAPEQDELRRAGFGTRELGAAVAAGRLLRLPGDVMLHPNSPARAMQALARLPQPFTLSEARIALGTTRRVAVPLLEHLDARGWTRRVDATRRAIVR